MYNVQYLYICVCIYVYILYMYIYTMCMCIYVCLGWKQLCFFIYSVWHMYALKCIQNIC